MPETIQPSLLVDRKGVQDAPGEREGKQKVCQKRSKEERGRRSGGADEVEWSDWPARSSSKSPISPAETS